MQDQFPGAVKPLGGGLHARGNETARRGGLGAELQRCGGNGSPLPSERRCVFFILGGVRLTGALQEQRDRSASPRLSAASQAPGPQAPRPRDPRPQILRSPGSQTPRPQDPRP
ncbi:unnamed protein product [Boreogadus saida]